MDKIYIALLLGILLYIKNNLDFIQTTSITKKIYIYIKNWKSLNFTNRNDQQKLNNTAPDITTTNIYFKITININGKKNNNN